MNPNADSMKRARDDLRQALSAGNENEITLSSTDNAPVRVESPDLGSQPYLEIVIFSAKRLEVLMRSRRKPQSAAIFVCGGDANFDDALASARQAMATMDARH
jgi:hypothetical protein